MKNGKLLASLLASVMVLGSAAGCSGGTESASSQPASSEAPASSASSSETAASSDAAGGEQLPGSGKTIAFVPKQLSNPYFVAVKDAVEAAAVENGFEFKVNSPDASTEVDKQINICEAFIGEGVDALVLIANDATALVNVVNEAAEKGIAVFLVDSGVDESNYISYIGTNNYDGGVMAAKWFGENVKGQVAVIDGFAGNQATTDRFNGFMDTIKEYPDIEVVTSDYGNGDMATSMTVAENFLTAYPDLAGIFCCDDFMAQGAGQAVQAAGKKDQITICGFDGSPEGAQAIIDGVMDVTIAQLPATMGRMSVESIIKHMNGEELEKVIYTPCEIVDKNNAQDYLTWH